MLNLIPNAHAIAILVFTVVAFFLFTRERIPIPVTSLIVITGLALGFHLFPYEQDGVELGSLGAAYWTGDGHKWLCAPKGSGILHVRSDLRAGIHPLAVSHGANDDRSWRAGR